MKIDKDIYNAILKAAIKAAPLEACGLLGGNDDHTTEFYELTNTDASSEHYSMSPEEQFATIKDMRSKGVKMLAIWHSHPETPARMSEEDLRLAFTSDMVYIILSLATPDKPDIRGFLLNDKATSNIDIELIESDSLIT